VTFVEVAVELPVRGLYHYALPAHLSAAPGSRVVVPFGNRGVSGIVVRAAETLPEGVERALDIDEVLDDEPQVGDELLALCLWIADYYEAPPGEVLPRRLEKLVNRTLPMGFQLSAPEREVLNALGEVPYLSARKIGEIARVGDPVGWMEQLMNKLGEIGLELVIPGDAIGGEPTYRLRR